MRLIIKEEYNNKEEMDEYIKNNNLIEEDYRYAVIALTFDKKGKILLQRRGDKARDGNGILADIGGAFEENDKTFRDALNREISEEVGNEANIKINRFISGVLETKYDPKTNKDVNWLFLLYECYYDGGKLIDNEVGKTMSYEFYDINNLPNDRLETSKFFWNYYMNYYDKCYSYAMGINERINKLDKNKFYVKEDDGDYEIVFDKKYINLWEEFIIKNMECNYWNDYIVDNQVRYIFKNDDGSIEKYILSKDNNEKILIKCRLFSEANFDTVKSMYVNTPFYSDKLDGVIFFD